MLRRPNTISHSIALLCAWILLLVLVIPSEAQPSPGYYPSSMIRSMAFSEGYDNLWGSQHQTLSQDRKALTVWMDRSSGSGFKSKRSYRNGYFGASIKVQPSTCRTTSCTLGTTTRSTSNCWARCRGSRTRCRRTCTCAAAATGGSSGGRCASTCGSTPPPTSTTTPSSGTPTRSSSSSTTSPSAATRRRWRPPSRSGRCGPTAPSGTPPTGPPTAAATSPTTATSPSSRASATSRSPGARPARRRPAARCRPRRQAPASARSSAAPCTGHSRGPWSTTTARITPGITPTTPSASQLLKRTQPFTETRTRLLYQLDRAAMGVRVKRRHWLKLRKCERATY